MQQSGPEKIPWVSQTGEEGTARWQRAGKFLSIHSVPSPGAENTIWPLSLRAEPLGSEPLCRPSKEWRRARLCSGLHMARAMSSAPLTQYGRRGGVSPSSLTEVISTRGHPVTSANM